MTQEQWIIYLYGIYPQGGFTAIYCLLLFAWTIFIGIMYISFATEARYEDRYIDNADYYKNFTWYKLGKTKIIIPAILSILIFFSNLVPDRNTFIALVATPSLIESLESENGKLNKLNKIIDLGLDKAMESLENVEESDEKN